jgi:hypothetical protein
LEQVSCTGRWDSETYERSKGALVKSIAVARAAAEPVSLWLMRQYMRTSEIRLGHPPGFAILTPDDGERDVQGWHSDFPYHWGIFATRGTGPEIPTHNFPELVMGVQRNLCVSEFRKRMGRPVSNSDRTYLVTVRRTNGALDTSIGNRVIGLPMGCHTMDPMRMSSRHRAGVISSTIRGSGIVRG